MTAVEREPYVFEEETWIHGVMSGRLYRIARPGRAHSSSDYVRVAWITEWITAIERRLAAEGALGENRRVRYVCLLGSKGNGRREIADYYDARKVADGSDEATLTKPLWKNYLNDLASGRLVFSVDHVPTTDHHNVPDDKLHTALERIEDALKRHETVLIGCSAAQGRTGEVIRFLRKQWLRNA